MTVRNLQFLFEPRSVAVIGASDRPGSVGAAVTHNVLGGGFRGPVALVNPAHPKIAGQPAFASIAALDFVPDLAVICTPPDEVPAVVSALGARGTRAAVVLTAGLDVRGADGTTARDAMLAAARPHLLRILGPNCVGLLRPRIGLNASFSHAPALPGRIAFLSQSGALTTALLDWARARDIGFSCFVSLGEAADIDFGDLINYLAGDTDTRSILLYVESIRAARKFMSAARAASRIKPLIVVKAGRAAEGAKAAASHTGALAGADDVYDAALRRAGALRVDSMEDLFVAAETLSRAKPLAGDRLAIVTNGGGLGVLAADALSLRGGRLAALSAATLERLSAALPRTWSGANPIDIIGDAPPERYLAALDAVEDDPDIDAVLLLHAPTAVADSAAIADACIPRLAGGRKPALTCWVGGEAVLSAQRLCLAAGLPTYETPEAAITGFLQMVQYRRNQQSLMETPPSLPAGLTRDPAAARRIVDDALAAGATMLGEAASKRILSAYGIRSVETRVATDVDAAVRIADELGYPVALKIASPDIAHKSDVGGVALDLRSPALVAETARLMLERAARARPEARLEGFAVEPMVPLAGAHELIVGIATDPVFGPVILFGEGGKSVEIVADRAVALPPLNRMLARDLIGRTRIAKILAGYRDVPAIDMEAVERVMLAVAQLAADIPEILELDINPLVAGPDGAIAVDARMRVARSATPGTERFAIRPYPVEWERRIDVDGRSLFVRPVRPEDEALYPAFLERVSSSDFYFRFFQPMRTFSHAELARFTQIDYDREMAFLAFADEEIVGVVRSISDPDNIEAEFAVLIRSDWTGKGVGHALMSAIVEYCRAKGTGQIFGEVLAHNHRMVELGVTLGFRPELHDGGVRLTLPLRQTGAGA